MVSRRYVSDTGGRGAARLRRSVAAGLAPVLLLVGVVGAGAPAVADDSQDSCDPLDDARCLLPFPNDRFTTTDAATDTGRRIDFDRDAMPVGRVGGHIDPTEWNRNDGYSPGSAALTFVPGLDLHATWGTQDEPFSSVGINQPGYFDHRDHIADIGRYLAPDAPMVIIDTTTGERHPFWSELDLNADPDDRLLILRPAVNFREGRRYVVALRNLRSGDGAVIPAAPAFAAYRDRAAVDARAAHMEELFATLASAGIAREQLFLAWDFTVASERNLSERVLRMRDDAFASIGDADLTDRRVDGDAPAFTITSVTDFPEPQNGAARRIEGSVTVPNYLDTADGRTGSRLNDPDGDGLPDRFGGQGSIQAPFVCNLPVAALSGGPAATPLIYGHGLLGRPSEQNGSSGREMRLRNFATCATAWIGMAQEDVPTVIGLLSDVSRFPTLPDRSQQGLVNFMFLGRALVHPDGLVSDPAFRRQGPGRSSTAAIRTAQGNSRSPLVYDGNSQGAIMGGAYMALTPDAERGVLGVAGMNYSTLLNRSVDWENSPLSQVFYGSYPDRQDQQLVMGIMQMLWDRGESNGYAQHMTDAPLPGTPSHDVLLQVAFGDHQVANVSAEVEARTIGAPLMVPALEDGKHWEADPFFIPTSRYPRRGSAMVYLDSGNATPPNGNVPAEHNGDPHEDPRREPAGSYQKDRFLTQGIVVDVCERQPYRTDDHPDAGGLPLCTGFPSGSRG